METLDDRRRGAPAQSGLQAVQRTFVVLRAIAAERGGGLRLSDVASRAGLHVATTQRLLRALAAERAVVYDPYSRLYHLGYDFLQQQEETLDSRLRRHLHPVLQRLSDLTHDSVFLSTRHGMDAFYIDSVHGRYPGSALPLDVGARIPLGAGPSGVVLLAALPAREQFRIIEVNEERYPRYVGPSTKEVRAMLRAYRQDGFAYVVDRVVPGLSGIAVPVHDDRDAMVGTLCIVTTNERLTEPRRSQVLAWMRRELEHAGRLAAAT